MDEFRIEVVETRHALRDPKWLTSNPHARADDLMEAFADNSIAGIISTIGGNDSIRLLPHIDLGVIRANPKVFLGYSDTTISHLACFKAGLTSFYGPAFMAGFAENGGMFPYMTESVRRALFSSEPIGIVQPNTLGWTVEHLDWSVADNQQRRRNLTTPTGWKFLQGTGKARGRLIGGCFEVLQWTRGTALWPDSADFDESILFLETSGEGPPPQQIAYELRALGAMGVLQRLAGILFGRPGGRIDPQTFTAYDDAILKVVRDELALTDLPIVTHMDFGHTDPIFVLPYGVIAEIDCDSRIFTIVESGLKD